MEQQKKTQFESPKDVICNLLRQFYTLGWCAGSGGGISIRESDEMIWLAPSGVQKELVQPDDIFVVNINGEVKVPPTQNLKPSECMPLFNAAYKLRRAGAVIHSHSLNATLVTRIFETEFHTIDLEMIKGIPGHSNTDWCRVPIIENTEKECELTERLSHAIIKYPRSYAVLVRNHGVYVWGPTWQKAKVIAECYDYLFAATLEMKKMNLDIPRNPVIQGKSFAWYVDPEQEATSDIRSAQQYKDPQWVDQETLKNLGIDYWKLDGEEHNEELEQICKSRNYNSRDQVKIGEKITPNYQELLDKFKTEHIHEDEEIRYIMDGSGFFDVRDKNDKWIRIQVVKGDMIVLPEGIYHRFTTDSNNYVHAMRLFKDEPVWTPYARPQDENPSRLKYVDSFLQA